MQKAITESVEILTTIGFNELEATAYTFLVENSPVTAYRVAQGIGKPVANTYKAVESLKEKGAVLIDETGNKLCRAVPPRELLQKMEKRFRRQQQKAERILSRLRPVEGDDGIYSLSTAEDVFNTCALMLERAEKVVLIDAFPQSLEDLKEHLLEASRRGVRVTAQTYGVSDIPEIECVMSSEANSTVEKWEGQWLCLVIDGAEYLFAYLDADGKRVHQAIWSRSAFLAWIQYGNMAYALLASELERLIKLGASQEELLEAIRGKQKWLEPNARGYQQLREKFNVNEREI
jgi:sugar-specific transcriptional regulator TrmB